MRTLRVFAFRIGAAQKVGLRLGRLAGTLRHGCAFSGESRAEQERQPGIGAGKKWS